MTVSKILVKLSSGENILPEEWAFVPGHGLKSSEQPKPDRELSLLSGELEEAIRKADGFCSKKFKANITTLGIDYSSLQKGTQLRIGQAVLEITQQGKRCFDECPVRQRGERCPLCSNCAFAKVLEGGNFAIGDKIEVLR